MVNIEDKNQWSDRAMNSKDPDGPKRPADETNKLADWRAQAGYDLARGARK